MTETLRVNREEEVTVPSGQSMMVETSDWARVRRNIEHLGEPLTERSSTFGSVLFGAALTLLGVIVPIELAKQPPDSSLIAGLWVSFGFCLLFAFLFFLIGKSEKKRYGTSNHAICGDMDDLAARAGHPGLGGSSPAPRVGMKKRILRWWGGDDPGKGAEATERS